MVTGSCFLTFMRSKLLGHVGSERVEYLSVLSRVRVEALDLYERCVDVHVLNGLNRVVVTLAVGRVVVDIHNPDLDDQRVAQLL